MFNRSLVTFLVSGGKWVGADRLSAPFLSFAMGHVFGVNNLVAVAVVILAIMLSY